MGLLERGQTLSSGTVSSVTSEIRGVITVIVSLTLDGADMSVSLPHVFGIESLKKYLIEGKKKMHGGKLPSTMTP